MGCSLFAAALNVFEDQADGGREAMPIGLFGLEIFFAGASEGIVFGAAIVFGFAPFGSDPGLLFEAVEGGIESALIDLEDVVGDLADALRDSPAVKRLEGNGLQDKQIESALDEVGGFSHERKSSCWLLRGVWQGCCQ